MNDLQQILYSIAMAHVLFLCKLLIAFSFGDFMETKILLMPIYFLGICVITGFHNIKFSWKCSGTSCSYNTKWKLGLALFYHLCSEIVNLYPTILGFTLPINKNLPMRHYPLGLAGPLLVKLLPNWIGNIIKPFDYPSFFPYFEGSILNLCTYYLLSIAYIVGSSFFVFKCAKKFLSKNA